MKLEQFLIKAKSSAYAGAGEGGEGTLADGSKELTFQQDSFKYRDRYFGWNPFAGEEVVWQRDKVIWTMNYYGSVSSEIVPAGQVYQFLQKAMKQVTEDRPFRGPRFFQEGDFVYMDNSRGNVKCFIGIEQIIYREKGIYQLDYHGGMIRHKA